MSSKFGTRKITADQMAELEQTFHEVSKESDGLDMDQFVEVFETVLGNNDDDNNDDDNNDDNNKRNDTNGTNEEKEDLNNKRYLTHLFMKIDANSDGTVDWEEFLNFLLLENQGLETSNFDQQRDMLVRESMQCDNYKSNHSNMISSILYLPNQSRYVSGSLDGTIKLWDTSSFQIKKTIINSPINSWVMDLVRLPLSNQIAAISMDGIVNIYNSNSWKLNSQIMNKGYILGENYGDNKKFNHEQEKFLITSTPVCANAAILNNINELLSVGTESGKAFLYILNNNSIKEIDDNNDKKNKKDDTSNNNLNINGSCSDYHICSGDQSLAPNQVSMKTKNSWNIHNYINNNNNNIHINDNKNAQIIHPILGCSHIQPYRSGIQSHCMEIHNDWITHIQYNQDLQSLVSCSLDSQIRFTDIERRKKTRIYMGHNRGIHYFAYNPEYKFMASCGVERKIHIFDPHRCARLQLLVGHTSSVSKILNNETRHQLISLSYDKVIKIWDTRTFRCLQTLHDTVGYQPDNRISALLFDNDNKRLITCSTKLQSWPIRFQTKKSAIKSHDGPVSAAYFNKSFEQCVSSDFNASIHVWDLENSDKVFKFSHNIETGSSDNTDGSNYNASNSSLLNAVGNKKEKVTTLAFDASQRRVITGTDMGTLRIWNFSSGQCLCEFRDHNSKYAHWKEKDHFGKQIGTEITGIVYVMEVSCWNYVDIHRWSESFRDKELRDTFTNILINKHKINGIDLLDLNHDILLNKYNINNIELRRKIISSITSLYQSVAISKYIVSVGWDNKIKVFIDNSNNKKPIQYPIAIMPSDINIKQSNQTEILCITHYPPNFIITGGIDGSIAIWNVVSGHFVKKIKYQKLAKIHKDEDTSCTQVCYLNRYKLIVTAHSNGTIVFWHSNQTNNNHNNYNNNNQPIRDESNNNILFGWRHTAHKRFGGISCMIISIKSNIIITCDNSSMLQIFEFNKEFNNFEINDIYNLNLKKYINRLNIWYTGHNRITCIDYLHSKKLILTSGDNGKILLWNKDGYKLGMFGQMTYFNNNPINDPIPKLWNLNDQTTWFDNNKNKSRNETNSIADSWKDDDNENNNKITDFIFDDILHKSDNSNNTNNIQSQSDNKEKIIKISQDTLNLLNNNHENKDNNNENDILSSPELYAILEKPSAAFIKKSSKNKRKNLLKSNIKRHLQTFQLDEIPKESPFK